MLQSLMSDIDGICIWQMIILIELMDKIGWWLFIALRFLSTIERAKITNVTTHGWLQSPQSPPMLRFDASLAKDLFCHLLARCRYLPTRVFSQMQTEQNSWENSYFIITGRVFLNITSWIHSMRQRQGRPWICTAGGRRSQSDRWIRVWSWGGWRFTILRSDDCPHHCWPSLWTRCRLLRSRRCLGSRLVGHSNALWIAPYLLRWGLARSLLVENGCHSVGQTVDLANHRCIWSLPKWCLIWKRALYDGWKVKWFWVVWTRPSCS